MHLQKFRVALMLALAIVVAVGAFAQTAETGAIAGRVTQAGTPLPGVTVEIRSPQLQGVRTAVTDAGGNFRFTLLPVGKYTLTGTLSGFQTVTENNVAVSLNHTTTVEVGLSPTASEQITVTGAAPVVDVTSNTQGANITSETMQSLPIGRNFVAAAQVAPGTSADASGTTVYGSSGAENEYVIDGLNTTGVQAGQQGKRLNQEFIQEVEVMTGGMPAEYGRMTGGAINAVTKSGSNEFHGDVFGYDTGGSLTAKNTIAARVPTTATTIGDVQKAYDVGGDLGGYIMKDRLWFFGAYDRTSETDRSTRINTALNLAPIFVLPVGGSVSSQLKRDLYAGKLSLALTSSQLFNLSLFGDPSTNDGAIFALTGPPSVFTGINKLGGNDINARYSGIFGTNWNVNAQAGQHKEKNTIAGPGASIAQVIDQTIIPNVRLGGYGYLEQSEFKRNTQKLDISSFFGSHQVKFGADREDVQAQQTRGFTGGDRPRKRCLIAIVNNFCPAASVYYIHEAYINTSSPTLSYPNTPAGAASLITNLRLNGITLAPKTLNTSAYIQDQWKLLTNFTVSAGVRWEEQKVGAASGATAIDLKHNIAPRLGLIWDIANNGRSKLYTNFGRFYESIPLDINIRTFGGETSSQTINFDPTPGHITPDVTAPRLSGFNVNRFRILGQSAAPVDPNLKGQYVDEYLAGYDYEIAPNLAVGIKGTYRNLGRVIEDMSAAGNYKVANPGSGDGVTTSFLFINGEVAVPKPKRQYKGVELHATKRFSNNYQFFTSYVWSQLKGNYDGTFQASTGQLDPNINSAYDYAEFAVNNNGFLSNDRTHVVKFYGSYTFSSGMTKGLDLGVATHWESGTPLTAYGYEPIFYRNYEMYLTPRGALGRGPSDYEADLHAGFPINFSGSSRLNLLVDVFNVFNRQSITTLDQRYELTSDIACAGIPAALCNGANGLQTILNPDGSSSTLTPIGQLTNPRATAPNPSFLKKGTAFTGARSIRLGARWTF
jgi:hypothetical protein